MLQLIIAIKDCVQTKVMVIYAIYSSTIATKQGSRVRYQTLSNFAENGKEAQFIREIRNAETQELSRQTI